MEITITSLILITLWHNTNPENEGKNQIRIAYVLNKKDLARSVEILRLGLAEYLK